MKSVGVDGLNSEDFIAVKLRPNAHVLLAETPNVVIDRRSLLRNALVESHAMSRIDEMFIRQA